MKNEWTFITTFGGKELIKKRRMNEHLLEVMNEVNAKGKTIKHNLKWIVELFYYFAND